MISTDSARPPFGAFREFSPAGAAVAGSAPVIDCNNAEPAVAAPITLRKRRRDGSRGSAGTPEFSLDLSTVDTFCCSPPTHGFSQRNLKPCAGGSERSHSPVGDNHSEVSIIDRL
ncbi:hypothetical protein GCM10027436_27870 [Actinophytocola sediminis]